MHKTIQYVPNCIHVLLVSVYISILQKHILANFP